MSKDTKQSTVEKKSAKPSKTTASKTVSKKTSPAAGATKQPTAIKRKPAAKAAVSSAPKTAAKPSPRQNRKPTGNKPAKMAGKRTVVSVEADVGFGNQIFIRGQGAGLSWDRGVPMTCQNSDHWEWSAPDATQPVEFKLLINDQLWSHGENEEVKPGETKVVQPAF